MKTKASLLAVGLLVSTVAVQAQLRPGRIAGPQGALAARRRVVAQPGGGAVINVRAFGAHGNGVDDDTAAVQKAIDAMPASAAAVANPGASPTATIFIPAGTYVISKTLVIPDGAAAYIVGEGMFATILDWHGAGDRKVIDVHATSYTLGFSLENLGIVNSVNAPNTTAIALGAGGVLLEAMVSRVLIDSHAIGVLLTGECDEATVFGSWFSGLAQGHLARQGRETKC